MTKLLSSVGLIEPGVMVKLVIAAAAISCILGCADDPADSGSGAGTADFAGAGGTLATNGLANTAGVPTAGSTAAAGAATSAAGRTTDTAAGAGGAGGASGNGSAGAGGKANAGGAGSSGNAGFAGGSAGAAGSSRPPWRIMPLGDSITETTCYPHLLWKKLRDTGHTNFDFVGTKINNQACGVSGVDQNCEGHGGYKVTDLMPNGPHAAELTQWCSADNAEIVLMHFGTNDAWSNIEPNKIVDAYSSVLTELRAVNPKVIVFVAQIIGLIPINTSSCTNCACATCDARIQALNALIPNWASSKSTADSPIYVVDLYTGFIPASDTPDGVHPNLTGAQKMADGWYQAIVAHNLF